MVPRVANLAHHHHEQQHLGGHAPSGYTQNNGDPMGAAQRAQAQAHAQAHVTMAARVRRSRGAAGHMVALLGRGCGRVWNGLLPFFGRRARYACIAGG